LIFPYGEWVIFFLGITTWIEKRASRRFFLILAIAWLIGKGIELVFPSTMPWSWHFARLAVSLVVLVCALQRAKRRIVPLLVTTFIQSMETLFLVNDPGVIPYGAWLFTGVLVVAAWLTAKCYWGTVAAFTGSVLVNQALVRFTNEGIVRHTDFPDAFVWNFGVILFAVWAGLRAGWQHWLKRKMQKTSEEPILPVHRVGVCDHSEERELQ